MSIIISIFVYSLFVEFCVWPGRQYLAIAITQRPLIVTPIRQYSIQIHRNMNRMWMEIIIFAERSEIIILMYCFLLFPFSFYFLAVDHFSSRVRHSIILHVHSI